MTSNQNLFTQIMATELSAFSLLNHPFYKAWSDGTLPVQSLKEYARDYYPHVQAFPRYVSAVHSHCTSLEDRQALLENLIDEERGTENHPELWARFAEAVGVNRSQLSVLPLEQRSKNLVQTMIGLTQKSYASGIGAVYAYEHQIPKIAEFKIDALKTHFGVQSKEGLAFFEVHKKADVYHTESLEKILNGLSEDQKKEAMASSKIAAKALWDFLDSFGIQSECKTLH